MGVCNTVRLIAMAIEESALQLNARHQLQLGLLKLMPLYNQLDGLTDWEEAIQQTLAEPDDESDEGRLIYLVYEFGFHNLYGAFDEPGTVDYFGHVAAALKENGIAVPELDDLSDW